MSLPCSEVHKGSPPSAGFTTGAIVGVSDSAVYNIPFTTVSIHIKIAGSPIHRFSS